MRGSQQEYPGDLAAPPWFDGVRGGVSGRFQCGEDEGTRLHPPARFGPDLPDGTTRRSVGGVERRGAMRVDCVRVTRASLPLCGNDCAGVLSVPCALCVCTSCKIFKPRCGWSVLHDIFNPRVQLLLGDQPGDREHRSCQLRCNRIRRRVDTGRRSRRRSIGRDESKASEEPFRGVVRRSLWTDRHHHEEPVDGENEQVGRAARTAPTGAERWLNRSRRDGDGPFRHQPPA